MTVISLSIRSYYLLSAALEFAPKDSVKCFLNAVHIAPQGGAAHVVATDASALFIGRAEAAPIPVVSCKYLTAVTKAAAALRPARERADLSAEIVNQMQAVFALADDAAAIVMGIRLDDRRRPSYERTAAAIMAD